MSKTAEYEKQPDGSGTTFRVTPAPAPKFWFLVIFGGFLLLIGLSMMGSSGGGGMAFLLMGGFSVWYGWMRDQRPKEHKLPATFRVTPNSIEVNGRSIRKEDIHRLLLRNGITDQELAGGMMYQVNTAQATGMMHRAKIGTVCNGLTVEGGGKSTILAGGMDETTAYGLMRDVSAVIGFSEHN